MFMVSAFWSTVKKVGYFYPAALVLDRLEVESGEPALFLIFSPSNRKICP